MDYIIVGAGPSALTMAWYLAKAGKTCTLVEQQPVIGGCHRVLREDGYFTEHGPRIYSTSYVNFKALLKNMNLEFKNLFTPYKFNIASIGAKTFQSVMSWREMFTFALAYLLNLPFPNYGKYTTMDEFMEEYNYSEAAHDYIDRLCRLSDGAGSARYTLHQFLQLINQEGWYSLQQPKLPNDKGLLKVWEEKLLETKRVKILLNTKVLGFEANGNKITSMRIETTDGTSKLEGKLQGKHFVLAIPPTHSLPILEDNILTRNAFGTRYKEWALAHEYLTYISITFHWNCKLPLPKVWGFSQTKWGLVFVLLSDYMKFTSCETVISVALTTYTGNDSKETLISETLAQLRESYPSLPAPDKSLVNPNNYQCNGWKDLDSGYVRTPYKLLDSMFVPFTSSFVNLSNVGTQNGKSDYVFTSIESAVSNAVSFVRTQGIEVKKFKGWKINHVFSFGVLFLLFKLSFYFKPSKVSKP